MITQKEQEMLWVLSDTELYDQDVEFMRGIAKALPTSQINGLLNVSLANPSYKQLIEFVVYQSERRTWRDSERYIQEFYKRLGRKLEELAKRASAILADRPEKASSTDEEEIKMELARAFIQHLLAENDYRRAMHAFTSVDDNSRYASKKDQERSRDNRRGSWQNSGGKRQ